MAARRATGRRIVVMQRKGGVGKSTVTVNLAVSLAERGKRVIILDLDPQRDSMDWAQGRKERHPHLPVIEAFAPRSTEELLEAMEKFSAAGYDVICDCPPGDSNLVVAAVGAADALINPFKAGGNDMRSVGRALALAAGRESPEAPPKLIAFINEFKPRFNNDKALKRLLEGSGIFRYAGDMPFRNEIKDSIVDFKSVWEFAPGSPGADAAFAICAAIDRSI